MLVRPCTQCEVAETGLAAGLISGGYPIERSEQGDHVCSVMFSESIVLQSSVLRSLSRVSGKSKKLCALHAPGS